MSSKKHIDLYSTIYGVDLVVLNSKVKEDYIRNNYTDYDGEEIEEGSLLDADGYTLCAIDKKTNKKTIIVYAAGPNPKLSNTDTDRDRDIELVGLICHEAYHVLLDLHNIIKEDISLDFQEPDAYMLGYIAKCIYTTVTKK